MRDPTIMAPKLCKQSSMLSVADEEQSQSNTALCDPKRNRLSPQLLSLNQDPAPTLP